MRNRHNRKRYPEGINSPLPITVWRKGRAEECDPAPFILSCRQSEGQGEIGTRADSDLTGSIAETEGVAPDHSPPRSRHPHTHVAQPLVHAVTMESRSYLDLSVSMTGGQQAHRPGKEGKREKKASTVHRPVWSGPVIRGGVIK